MRAQRLAQRLLLSFERNRVELTNWSHLGDLVRFHQEDVANDSARRPGLLLRIE